MARERFINTVQRIIGELGKTVELFGFDLPLWINLPGMKPRNENLVRRQVNEIRFNELQGRRPFLVERLWFKLVTPTRNHILENGE